MAFRGIHHVGVAVLDLDEAIATYERLFGATLERRGLIEGQGVEAAYLRVGAGRVELLSATGPDTPVARFLAKRGPGIHHLAFEAASRAAVNERADWLRSQGAEIESGPEEYWYMPGYYAVFFYDPDGMKLEILNVPGHAA